MTSPILFANSFPKSGTHLLTQVLQGFTRIGPAVNSGLPAVVTFRGDTGRQHPVSKILEALHKLKPGDCGYGHVHAVPETVAVLCRDGWATFFIMRDPRDVVVSHANYISKMADHHIHHHYYSKVLTNLNERLIASISGIPNTQSLGSQLPPVKGTMPFELPDIYARFEPYLGWLNHPEVLVVRFEDFAVQKMDAIRKVLDHALARGFQLHCSFEKAVDSIASSIDPKRSPTYHIGKVGSWREAFSEEHKKLFKSTAGGLLIRLGYEQDNHW